MKGSGTLGYRGLVFWLGLAISISAGCQRTDTTELDHDKVADDHAPVIENLAPSDDTTSQNDPRSRPRIGAGAEDPTLPTRPRLPQRPIRPGTVNDITFDDLELKMPLDSMFDRKLLTDRAQQLDNQKVRIRGFIFAGGVFRQTGITSFPLVMNTQCKFGPGGFAYCVIMVDLNDGVSTDFTTRPVTVEGTLSVRPFDSAGFTWSVYHIQGTRVM